MSLEYIIYDDKNKKLASTIKKENEPILKIIDSSNKLIEFESIKFRVGYKKTTDGYIACLSSDKNYIKSSKMFNTDLNMLVSSLKKIKDAVEEAELYAFRQMDILIHNLKTINAHSIQDTFYFLPPEILNGTSKEVTKAIRNKIKNDTSKATELFFKILKNNAEMKAEFSVFSKLYEDNPLLNFKEFDLNYALLNVIYNFFPEFTDKNVDINFEKKEILAYFDYESIHVAFFHMIDNISKYIKKDTLLNINFNILIDEVEILFDMISLKISSEEIEDIFEDGYSGKYAIKFDRNGKGIGMSRVKKLLELNSGTINVITKPYDEYYSQNTFKLTLKRNKEYIR